MREGLGIVEILVAIVIIALAMMGVTEFVQTQYLTSINLTTSAKNIAQQHYLDKLILSRYIDETAQPSQATNATAVCSPVTYSAIWLSSNKTCETSATSSALARADIYIIYPNNCSGSGTLNGSTLTLSCSSPTATTITFLNNNTNILRSMDLMLYSASSAMVCTVNQISNFGSTLTLTLESPCNLSAGTYNVTMPRFLAVFSQIQQSRRDGYFRYYY